MILPKHRAWDYNYKKMWKVVAMSEPTYDDCEEPYIKVCEFDKSPMDKETDIRFLFNFDLMRFTGLYDKNDKEIYERDIVSYFGLKYEVLFKNGAFGWMEDGEFYSFNEMARSEFNKFEIIGNVYENPELLEESK